MSDVIILDHLKEPTEEQFKKFIIGECRRMDRLDVYEWVADDELKIKQLQQENNQLKEKINTYENPEDLTLMFMYCDEKAKDKIKDLNEKVDYLKNKCENKDKWCQLIADIGYDYDGYRQADSLMKLIDELVKYAIWSRDNYDYDAFQEEGNNE